MHVQAPGLLAPFSNGLNPAIQTWLILSSILVNLHTGLSVGLFMSFQPLPISERPQLVQ